MESKINEVITTSTSALTSLGWWLKVEMAIIIMDGYTLNDFFWRGGAVNIYEFLKFCGKWGFKKNQIYTVKKTVTDLPTDFFSLA